MLYLITAGFFLSFSGRAQGYNIARRGAFVQLWVITDVWTVRVFICTQLMDQLSQIMSRGKVHDCLHVNPTYMERNANKICYGVIILP